MEYNYYICIPLPEALRGYTHSLRCLTTVTIMGGDPGGPPPPWNLSGGIDPEVLNAIVSCCVRPK